MGKLSYSWNDSDVAAEAAAFAASVIGSQPSYISHGEIQTGLSPDGEHWAADLAALYTADFSDPGDRDMLVSRDEAGAIRGMLIVAWEASQRRRFAVIEDMAVDPVCRGEGIGGEMLALAQERIRARGIEWVFLESGLGNEEAHRFFERAGFRMTSHVFARKLDQ